MSREARARPGSCGPSAVRRWAPLLLAFVWSAPAGAESEEQTIDEVALPESGRPLLELGASAGLGCGALCSGEFSAGYALEGHALLRPAVWAAGLGVIHQRVTWHVPDGREGTVSSTVVGAALRFYPISDAAFDPYGEILLGPHFYAQSLSTGCEPGLGSGTYFTVGSGLWLSPALRVDAAFATGLLAIEHDCPASGGGTTSIERPAELSPSLELRLGATLGLL